MKFLLSFLLPLFAVLAQMDARSQDILWADPITGEDPGKDNPFNPNATGGGATKAAHITVSGIGRKLGRLLAPLHPNIYAMAAWNNAALDADKCYSFTLTPDPNYTINFTVLNCHLVSFGADTGPTTVELRYSIGGGAITPVGTPQPIARAANADNPIAFSFPLNISNVTSPITFYLYAYGGSSPIVSSFFGVADFEFNGFLIEPQNEDLPVTFGNLQATRNNGNVNIEWSTLTETHNSHFDVEISADGNTFKKVATIQSKAANGMSAMPLSYRFSLSANQVTGFAVPALFALLAVGFKNRRWRKAFVSLSLASILFIAACSKKEAQGVQTKDNLFVRITQVDIDGGKSFSKIIKVVEGN